MRSSPQSGSSPPPGGGSAPPGGRVARATYLGLVLGLAASGTLNALLARRVRELGQAVAAAAVGARVAPLAVGAVVPPITATGLDGARTTIAYDPTRDGRLTVLYVFTPQCGWCARNLDNLKALLRAKQGAPDVRFIGLSLAPDSVGAYVAQHGLTPLLPVVVTRLSAATMTAYHLGGTPQTVVISPAARVVRNWQGAWTAKSQAEIEAFFHVTLPGLQLPAAATATTAPASRTQRL
jgi:hypothetical protein